MPNGEILPAGPGITWTRARPCSNLFDRVSYFSARSRPRSPWKKSFARRAMRRDATRRDATPPPIVVVSKSCLQVAPDGAVGAKTGRAKTRMALMAPDTHGRLSSCTWKSHQPHPASARPAHFGSSPRSGC